MIPMRCRKDKDAFVNKPFINWRKLQEKAKRHEQMKYHHEAMIATESFLNSVENPEQNVNHRLHDEKRKNVTRKRHIVKCVSEAILFCGRQCIPLRGDNKVLNGNSRGNTGNFLAALQMVANQGDICMGQERLSSIAPMHIHYQVKIDSDEVVNLFATKHPRRLKLGTILVAQF